MSNTIWDTLTGRYYSQNPRNEHTHNGAAICAKATAHYNALSPEQKERRAEHSRKPNAKEVPPAVYLAAAAKSPEISN